MTPPLQAPTVRTRAVLALAVFAQAAAVGAAVAHRRSALCEP